MKFLSNWLKNRKKSKTLGTIYDIDLAVRELNTRIASQKIRVEGCEARYSPGYSDIVDAKIALVELEHQ
jgi:hypothetical protein